MPRLAKRLIKYGAFHLRITLENRAARKVYARFKRVSNICPDDEGGKGRGSKTYTKPKGQESILPVPIVVGGASFKHNICRNCDSKISNRAREEEDLEDLDRAQEGCYAWWNWVTGL